MKITRIYVDNYRCLQDFTFHPKDVTLLMGVNGSGKSSIREVLFKLRQALEGFEVRRIFSQEHITAWNKSEPKQKFQFDIEINNRSHQYKLGIIHDFKKNECEIYEEQLVCDGAVLFESNGAEAKLFSMEERDSFVPLMTTTERSVLNLVPKDSKWNLVNEFQEVLHRLVVVAISPSGMPTRSDAESAFPSEHFSNFLDWLRLQSGQNPEEYFKLFQALSQVLPGFHAIKFEQAGEGVKECFLKFSNAESGEYRIRFDQISDGQRVLVILYSLLAFAEYYPIVFLDEPQNFVSLQEIKPWLLDAMDKYEDVGGQLLLSSHNSEFINLLAPKYGVWFERTPSGPTQVKLDVDFSSSPLRPSQLITRGWIDE